MYLFFLISLLFLYLGIKIIRTVNIYFEIMSSTRVKEIEEQLAYLNWRKMQNERSVRESLETSRAMKQKDVMIGVAKSRRDEKIVFYSTVVQDELTRPLVLDDVEMSRIQAQEQMNKDRAYMREIHHLESSNKIEQTLRARLPGYNPGRADRFSNSPLVVNEFARGETEEEVRAFKDKQRAHMMSKSKRKSGSTLKLVPESSNPGLRSAKASASGRTLQKTMSNISASSNEARIVHTQEKLSRITQIKMRIDENVMDISASKPIVNAKWQPPLPT